MSVLAGSLRADFLKEAVNRRINVAIFWRVQLSCCFFFCMFYSIVVWDEKTPQKVAKNIWITWELLCLFFICLYKCWKRQKCLMRNRQTEGKITSNLLSRPGDWLTRSLYSVFLPLCHFCFWPCQRKQRDAAVLEKAHILSVDIVPLFMLRMEPSVLVVLWRCSGWEKVFHSLKSARTSCGGIVDARNERWR